MKIFVGYDSRSAETIFATTTMNGGIKMAIRYMSVEDLTVEFFSHDDEYTVIEYSTSFRIGAEIIEQKGVITIMATNFHESE